MPCLPLSLAEAQRPERAWTETSLLPSTTHTAGEVHKIQIIQGVGSLLIFVTAPATTLSHEFKAQTGEYEFQPDWTIMPFRQKSEQAVF